MRIPSALGFKNFFKHLYQFKLMMPWVWLLLGISRFRVLFTSFNAIAQKMGQFQQETTEEISTVQEELFNIGKLIRYVSRFTPWKSNCFAQALCAHHLLAVKAIDHTIYFGVRKDESGALKAHAWLRAGSLIVTGGAGHESYTVTGKFGYFSN